ncbi:MAG: lamin tail domain-containing protein, partial [Bacteroidota bacterium]
VNGNFHGVYASIESINSQFFEQRFYSNPDNPRFEANPNYNFDELPTPPFGCTQGHGASLEYLGGGDICYFEHYQLQSATGWSDLKALAQLLENEPQNAKDLLDLDRWIWMSALNSLLANLDSYLGASPRNYYLFKADNGHFVPVPDDVNESFARFPWAEIPQTGEPQPPLGFYMNLDPFLGENDEEKPLLKAIFANPTWKKMYVAHLRTMLFENFISGWLDQQAGELQSLIASEVQSDANHFYTYDDFLNNLNQTVVDSYNGEDAFGLLLFANQRMSALSVFMEIIGGSPPFISNVAASPAAPAPGTSVTITASITNASAAWLGHRANLKEVFTLSQLFDDGAHGDGAAGDGVFGASVTVGVGGLQYYVYAENGQAGMFSPERAEFEFYSLATAGNVVINELMASNQNTVADQNGEFDDWVELYNNGSSQVNLSGWYLSDDSQVLTKWQFPAGVFLDPGAYLIVWLDDDETQAGLHASFNLSANGEEFFLSMPNESIADQVIFGAQEEDVSLARCPNGMGAFQQIPPSFGASNNAACAVPVEDLAENFALKIYPNPASDWLFIETEAPGDFKAELVNAFGQQVMEIDFAGKTAIDVAGLPAGVYFFVVEKQVVRRIVLAKS